MNIRFEADPLPEDFTGTMSDFQTRFITNLRGTIDDTQILIGQVGGVRPDSDIGPWLNGTTWHVWNGSEYVPSTVKVGGAGYVVQLGSYTTVGDSQSILPDRAQTFQDKDGVVALLSDVYVGRPCVTLTGATPNIDWGRSKHFAQVLSANATFAMTNSQPGQRIIATINNPAAWTVTWPSYIFWEGGTAPTQTTTGLDKYEFENIGGSILGKADQDFS